LQVIVGSGVGLACPVYIVLPEPFVQVQAVTVGAFMVSLLHVALSTGMPPHVTPDTSMVLSPVAVYDVDDELALHAVKLAGEIPLATAKVAPLLTIAPLLQLIVGAAID